MRTFFLLIRIYPYFAVPCIWVALEVGLFYHRRQSANQWILWMFSMVLFCCLVLWIRQRGDLYAERWISYLYHNVFTHRL